jgi:hypothetical protein
MIVPVFTMPCASPAGMLSCSVSVPVRAQPVDASDVTVFHRSRCISMPLPLAWMTTSMSPVVRHGIFACPLFHRRESRLNSKARYVALVPPPSRCMARYSNVSAPGWSTADQPSRMLAFGGLTPLPSSLKSHPPGWSSLVPPANARSGLTGSGLCTTRPAACRPCQSMKAPSSI